jgi:hypothetical protein
MVVRNLSFLQASVEANLTAGRLGVCRAVCVERCHNISHFNTAHYLPTNEGANQAQASYSLSIVVRLKVGVVLIVYVKHFIESDTVEVKGLKVWATWFLTLFRRSTVGSKVGSPAPNPKR